jgi:hypothetical protein
MLVVRTTEDPANSVGELVSSQQSVGFYDLALAVYPLGLYVALSHGLCLGSRQLTILTPRPLVFTSRLCFPSQRLTSLEMCQLALSQMRSSTLLPAASSFSQHHERNRVVMELTGLPSTNLNHVSSSSSGR